jgi:hypothetical protein
LESARHSQGCGNRALSLPPIGELTGQEFGIRSKRNGARKGVGIRTSTLRQLTLRGAPAARRPRKPEVVRSIRAAASVAGTIHAAKATAQPSLARKGRAALRCSDPSCPDHLPPSFNDRTLRSERRDGGLIPSGGATVQWRNGNAAVCKTAMSRLDTGLHLHRSNGSNGQAPIF